MVRSHGLQKLCLILSSLADALISDKTCCLVIRNWALKTPDSLSQSLSHRLPGTKIGVLGPNGLPQPPQPAGDLVLGPGVSCR